MSAVSTLRILGIDPGLRVTGFGIIDQTGQQLVYVASGCVRSGAGELPERLKVLLEGLQEVIAEYRPQCAAIEQVFVNVNPKSTLLLGQVTGYVNTLVGVRVKVCAIQRTFLRIASSSLILTVLWTRVCTRRLFST